MSDTVLFDYWRSSASYRVRIALNLLDIPYRSVPIDLLAGQHKQPDHLARNPQGLVPALDIDGHMLTQSLAIIEYLSETRPQSGLLPADPLGRHRVRALSYAIAMDIHPVCNLGVVFHVMQQSTDPEAARAAWMRKFIGEGLAAFEKMLDNPLTGAFCHGEQPTMADICLVPQVYNAERWGADLSGCPRLVAIAERCRKIPAFEAAQPTAPA
ncbi:MULTISPECIES: maleylacetoacetate isomerase [unclassified Rhizobium]|uniref:maleylacetoacetate isomerase n=1 Tax=unclassified Rhizobium TaxID=2613769 RepID=UPI0007127EE1|nr:MULTISPECIES: maleylacetoacetate isomerase [unclassified Rhizobium]KQS89711.1 maleylacetoacetate isomerase [Rhizobium sp. Leaf391]KQS94991.1 maleylacetoacetate isomerase [Rhizobium sp. Leaf386]KQU01367.1 maleylacetoacetate isomerase [Rhizobium sp. Leaf453]